MRIKTPEGYIIEDVNEELVLKILNRDDTTKQEDKPITEQQTQSPKTDRLSRKIYRRKSNFTEEADQYLIENYEYMTGKQLAKDLAKMGVNTTSIAIHSRAHYLRKKGFKIPYKQPIKQRTRKIQQNTIRPRYTQQQIQFIKDNYHRLTARQIAEYFAKNKELGPKRTTKGIEQFIQKNRNRYGFPRTGLTGKKIKRRKKVLKKSEIDKKTKRYRFITSRTNDLMKKYQYSRTKAWNIAVQEWKMGGRLGSVKPKQEFDWEQIMPGKGDEVRKIIEQHLLLNATMWEDSFSHLLEDKDYDWNYLCTKILYYSKDILQELGYRGKIIKEGYSLMFIPKK